MFRTITAAAFALALMPTAAALASEGITTNSDAENIHNDIYSFARASQGNPQVPPAPGYVEPRAGRDFYAISPEQRARSRRNRN